MSKKKTTEVELISQGCCNKISHTGWLKTTEIYSLTAMEARGPKQRCMQGRALSKASRERILPASSSLWWFYGPLACGCITTISAFIFIWPSPLSASLFCVSLIRTLVIGFRVHLIIQDEFISRSLKIYICKDPFFPQKWSHSQFWGCRNII